MKVYDIETKTITPKTHRVVAESIEEAARAHYEKYPSSTISQIVLHSEYVTVAKRPALPHRLCMEEL